MTQYYKDQIKELADGIIRSVDRIETALCVLENSRKDVPDLVKAIEGLSKEAQWLSAIQIDITIIQEIVEREL